MNEIPKHIAKLVQDIDWSKDFIFEKMPCDHDVNAAEHIKINCEKCSYDSREKYIENYLTNATGKETILDENKKVKTISKILILRGKYNDCIGVQTEYS